jgi:PAS domain S-box-containing protein
MSHNTELTVLPAKGAGTPLAQTEEFLQAVLDGIQDVIKIVDENYDVIYANRAAKTETRRHPMELVGEKCFRGFYQRDEFCPFCQTSYTFEKAKPMNVSYTLPLPNGQKRHIELSTFPIKNKEGKVKYVIEITRDVTRQKVLEEQVRKHERLAAIGELAAGMAHEIRNPLSSIVTASNLLSSEAGMPIDEEQLLLLEVVKKEAQRLNAILTDFLSYARPREPQLSPVNLNEVVNETLDILERDRSTNGHVTIQRNLDETIPEVEMDPDQMKQVILNIAMNGVEAMPHGGNLTVATMFCNGQVHVQVSDTGVGISESELPRIFQPFHSTKKNGTGLGLAIAHHIVSAHKGEILVETQEGMGTKMTIQLPVKRGN